MYKLLDSRGNEYSSDTPGLIGGHRLQKTYGRLDCPSAKRWLKQGHYKKYRVFFKDEQTAIDAGYRPCGACMKSEYLKWKILHES